MAQAVELTTPNGHRYTQPTGLFINNEFVPSTGQTITSLDPAYVPVLCGDQKISNHLQSQD